MKIGDRILRLLQNRNMTQKQLAERLNISYTTLNGYVKNNREPDYTTIIAIAKFFEVSVDYLLGALNSKHIDNLTDTELKLIKLFRFLPYEQQDFFIEQIRLIIQINNKK